MKILHLINSLETGGAEKLLLQSLPLYGEHGITTDLLLLKETNSPFLKELVEKKCCAISSLGLASVYNPIHIFKMIPFFNKYDIIHVHLFPAQYYAVAVKILSRSKAKLIFTEHSTNNRRFQNKRFKFIDRFIYNSYDHIIGITPKVKEAVINQTGILPHKITVIYNGISLKNIHEASPYSKVDIASNIKDADKLIIQVSSFQEPKDHETLIKAMILLPNYFKLILVGEGLLKEKCEKLVTSLGLENRILFLGVRMDIPQLLKTADIVVLSSKYEGLSLSSIEGMASGRPFVASDVPGLKEVVSGAGILFPVGNEKQLAQEILYLSTDAEHYETSVTKCLARAQQYDISKMVAEHIDLYKKILKIPS